MTAIEDRYAHRDARYVEKVTALKAAGKWSVAEDERAAEYGLYELIEEQ